MKSIIIYPWYESTFSTNTLSCTSVSSLHNHIWHQYSSPLILYHNVSFFHYLQSNVLWPLSSFSASTDINSILNTKKCKNKQIPLNMLGNAYEKNHLAFAFMCATILKYYPHCPLSCSEFQVLCSIFAQLGGNLCVWWEVWL